MAKRFTESNKWDKKWYRKLNLKMKSFWTFILDKCDCAGIWDIDFEAASYMIGDEITEPEVLEAFKDQIIKVSNTKIFIIDFVPFQYGPELKNSPIHKKVAGILEKYGLFKNNKIRLPNTLQDTLSNRVQEKEKEKEEDKVKDKVKEEEKENEKEKKKEQKIVFPFSSVKFTHAWHNWKEYKQKEFNFKYKSLQSEQAALSELNNLSNQNEKIAIAIIHQSMAKGWKGFFKLKKDRNENDRITYQDISDYVDTMYAG